MKWTQATDILKRRWRMMLLMSLVTLPIAIIAMRPAQGDYFVQMRFIVGQPPLESTLDDEQEIAMGFTDTGTGVLRIEGLGYFDPDIVTFYGTDQTGARVQLVQHVSQLNVMLRALPKPAETTEAARIGFRLAQDLEAS